MGDAPYDCFTQSWRVALRMCRPLLTTFRALNGAVDQVVALAPDVIELARDFRGVCRELCQLQDRGTVHLADKAIHALVELYADHSGHAGNNLHCGLIPTAGRARVLVAEVGILPQGPNHSP